jgi:hypothetical protein
MPGIPDAFCAIDPNSRDHVSLLVLFAQSQSDSVPRMNDVVTDIRREAEVIFAASKHLTGCQG